MPDGYRVTLGDGVLDVGDSISDPLTTFTTQTNLGAGQWTITGVVGGSPFGPATEPGVYFLGTDGFVYFVPDFGPVDSISSSSVVSSPTYADAPTDNQVDGTSGADVIDNTYTDADGDSVDDGSGFGPGGLGDYVLGGAGADDISSGDGDDLVFGDGGSDTIDGGAGNDTIDGDGTLTPSPPQTEFLDWTDQGGNGTDLSSGFTQNTGLMDVTVSFSDDGNNVPTFEVSTDANYTEGGEPFDSNSSLEMFGDGDAATSTTTIDFAAATPGATEEEVENVSFRINDIDFFADNHRDIITVNAFDADGNAVTVTLTPEGADTVVGNTITASDSLEDPDDAAGSVLVEIAGPVSSIEIIYSNGLNGTQAINVTDVYFDATPIDNNNDSILGGAGDDVILGGLGDDTLRGNGGADTITGGAGADALFGNGGEDVLNVGDQDTARGGGGDDEFVIDPTALDGGAMTIIGGENGETDGDTLNFNGQLDTITFDANPENGTATLLDGTVVTFSQIENIICFTAGTLIQTPHGERRIDTLRAGDVVLTMDNGPQAIRWIGTKTVRASGVLAPIHFRSGAIGNTRDLLVSPQHRMLCTGYRAQLHFGESEILAPAKSLVNDFNITIDYGGMVIYVHMLFDSHQIVIANGAPSESFYPGGTGLDAIEEAARSEVFELFPELRSNIGSYGPASRVCVKPHEARAMAMM